MDELPIQTPAVPVAWDPATGTPPLSPAPDFNQHERLLTDYDTMAPKKYYDFPITQTTHKFHRDMPPSTVWAYNGGAQWSPIEGMMFRGNYARAVRAPNLSETAFPLVNKMASYPPTDTDGGGRCSMANRGISTGAYPAAAKRRAVASAPGCGRIISTFTRRTYSAVHHWH